MTDALLRWFDAVSPATRRRWTARLLMFAGVLWLANRVLWGLGILSHGALDAITNDLSWWALIIGCMEALISTDVRKEQEES